MPSPDMLYVPLYTTLRLQPNTVNQDHFLPCFFSASWFENGNPAVLLSAPVVRLIFP